MGDNAFNHVLKVTDCLDKTPDNDSGIFRITPMCGLHFIAPGLGKSIVDTMLGAMSVQSKADLDRLVALIRGLNRKTKVKGWAKRLHA